MQSHSAINTRWLDEVMSPEMAENHSTFAPYARPGISFDLTRLPDPVQLSEIPMAAGGREQQNVWECCRCNNMNGIFVELESGKIGISRHLFCKYCIRREKGPWVEKTVWRYHAICSNCVGPIQVHSDQLELPEWRRETVQAQVQTTSEGNNEEVADENKEG